MGEEKNEVEGTKKEMRLLNTTCNIIIRTKMRKKKKLLKNENCRPLSDRTTKKSYFNFRIQYFDGTFLIKLLQRNFKSNSSQLVVMLTFLF